MCVEVTQRQVVHRMRIFKHTLVLAVGCQWAILVILVEERITSHSSISTGPRRGICSAMVARL